MPITKSAKKALRQSERKRIRNLRKKREVKETIKKVESLVSQKKIKEAKELLSKIYKVLDKSVKTGIIKKNKAAREKSRISKIINKGAKKS